MALTFTSVDANSKNSTSLTNTHLLAFPLIFNVNSSPVKLRSENRYDVGAPELGSVNVPDENDPDDVVRVSDSGTSTPPCPFESSTYSLNASSWIERSNLKTMDGSAGYQPTYGPAPAGASTTSHLWVAMMPSVKSPNPPDRLELFASGSPLPS